LQVARDDLSASNRLAGPKGVPHASAYLAEQAAEKALKAAILQATGQEPPWTHDLDALRNRLPGDWDVKRRHRDLAVLTYCGTAGRYPDSGQPPATGRQAAGARRTATSLYESIRRDLAARGVNVTGLSLWREPSSEVVDS
jgi:HEPN domain-containing protein